MLGVCQTVVYVVDELLNEDQRTILHIVQHIMKNDTGQALVIVHNWKRLSQPNYALVQDQIIRTFAAKPLTLGALGHPIPGLYSSSWRVGIQLLEVTHAVLFNHDQCAALNENVFRQLQIRATEHSASKISRSPILTAISREIARCLSSYVKVIESENPKAQAPRAHAYLEIELGENAALEHLGWELREMPAAHSAGAYKPRAHAFSRVHEQQQQSQYVIRIDLPGMKKEDIVRDGDDRKDDELDSKSWLKITPCSEKPGSFKIDFEGFRACPPNLEGDRCQSFGHFKLSFVVPNEYHGAKFRADLIDGCLVFSATLKKPSQIEWD
jgi:hypothetical protein